MRLPRYRVYGKFAKLKRQIIDEIAEVGLLRRTDPRDFYPLREGQPSIFQPPPLFNDRVNTSNQLQGSGDVDGEPRTNNQFDDEDKARRELDRENFILKHLSLIPKIVNRMGALYRETNGRSGVLLEYHQKVPSSAAFAGFAAVRLGEVAIAKYRRQLENMFNTIYFDTRQQVKFGRRAGKSYMACLIVAVLLVSQPNCSGILMCLNQKLASTNSDEIIRMVKYIIEDSRSGIKAELLPGGMSEGVIRVRSCYGTINKVLCTPDPRRSNLRGQGSKEGFFFLDESDFYAQETLDLIQPIWSMRILVCMYTSQGYSRSAASTMVTNSILPNGRRVWREYFIKPGRISLIISEDYVPPNTLHQNTEGYIAFGRGNPNANNQHGNTTGADAAAIDPLRSLRRPWYNPVMQTLSFQTYQLRQLELESEEKARARVTVKGKSRAKRVTLKTSKTKIKTPAKAQQPKADEDVTMTESDPFADYVTHLEALVTDHDNKSANMWTTAECVWLLTLPSQQDPIAMMQLKVTMKPEAFAREMLSDIPELNYELRPTFSAEAIDRLFHPMNRFARLQQQRPLRWLVGFDPAAGGSSDSTIVSILVLSPLPIVTAAATAATATTGKSSGTQKGQSHSLQGIAYKGGLDGTHIQPELTQDVHGGSTTMARAMERTGSRSLQQAFVVRPHPWVKPRPHFFPLQQHF